MEMKKKLLMYESIMYCILNTVSSFDWVFCFSYPFVAELKGTESHNKDYQTGTIFLQETILSTYLST